MAICTLTSKLVTLSVHLCKSRKAHACSTEDEIFNNLTQQSDNVLNNNNTEIEISNLEMRTRFNSSNKSDTNLNNESSITSQINELQV